MNIKENISNLIFKSGVSMYKISKATGVSEPVLGRYKNGSSQIDNMPLETALKLNSFYESLNVEVESATIETFKWLKDRNGYDNDDLDAKLKTVADFKEYLLANQMYGLHFIWTIQQTDFSVQTVVEILEVGEFEDENGLTQEYVDTYDLYYVSHNMDNVYYVNSLYGYDQLKTQTVRNGYFDLKQLDSFIVWYLEKPKVIKKLSRNS